MNGGAVFRIRVGDGTGDDGTPVAALRHVAFVAQTSHQMAPFTAYLFDSPTGLAWFVRKTEAGEGRTDHVESILRAAAVRRWIGQWFDDLGEFEHRTGPAVGDDQGQRVGFRRAHVNEMDAKTVEFGLELGKTVESGLGAPPVVVRLPVVENLAHVVERDALRPVPGRFRFRETGHGQAGVQVVQFGIIDGEFK